WLNVPGLKFDSTPFKYAHEEDFARFMERFMDFNHGSHLQKFEITGYRYGFMELINTVVDLGIQHLEVFKYPCSANDFMCQNIYKSKTLVSLNLVNIELKNPEFVVSLPCLKIMHLSNVCHGEDGPLVVERLISGCPVLEDLKLIRPFNIWTQKVLKNFKLFLHVRSQTLKSLGLYFAMNRGDTDFSVEIYAPRLKYMSVEQIQMDSIVVKNLSSLFRIDIRIRDHPSRPDDYNIFCDFLTGISSVRHMIIYLWSLEV
ncbi:unnamed protein product, partial [Arabidopsis halleri]